MSELTIEDANNAISQIDFYYIESGLWKYCSPYKRIELSCGHKIMCEFSQYYVGQHTYCPTCHNLFFRLGPIVVLKCINTVTGKEYERL